MEIGIIEGFYCEAERMLPLESMPELRGCILVGGHCFGLADPVSNIILNAIGLLAVGGGEYPAPHQIGDGQWYQIAHLSCRGLRAFMTTYFRYLSPAEAVDHLRRSSYFLSSAISSIQLNRAELLQPSPLLPDGGKIKAALRAAAIEARHPDPDILAGLMTAQYPSNHLRHAMATLQQGKPLRSDGVEQIKSLLRLQWPLISSQGRAKIEFSILPVGNCSWSAQVDGTLLDVTTSVGENLVARIVVEHEVPNEERSYIPDETRTPRIYFPLQYSVKNIEYLKMSLLDTMHASYIKALAKLPSSGLNCRLLRALLIAGHCYGPLDIVSNIILNSIWYDIAFPPTQGAEDQLPQGILSTKSMSRLASCSLDGMVTMSNMFHSECGSLTFLRDNHFSLSHLPYISYAAVAQAANNPKHTAFASFVMSQSHEMRTFLLSLLTQPGRLTDSRWAEISTFLRNNTHVSSW